ncbi:hypothetical protein GCM10020254_70060 [Streptomyces goshikiensis]
MIAYGGRTSATAASCSRRSSGGAKPSSPTPQGRSPSRSAVSASSLRTSGPVITASARYGTPPAAATASAKAAWSLTRVIGPLGDGERTPERAGPGRRLQVPGDGVPYGLEHPARRAVAVGQPGRRGPVLPDGQQLGPQVPGAEQGRGGALRRGQVGPGVHPVALDEPGLGPVHRP